MNSCEAIEKNERNTPQNLQNGKWKVTRWV